MLESSTSMKSTHQYIELNCTNYSQVSVHDCCTKMMKIQRNIDRCPIGSTIVKTKEKQETFISIMNEVSTKYSEMRYTLQKILKGEFLAMVDKIKKTYGVNDDVSFSTIISRL